MTIQQSIARTVFVDGRPKQPGASKFPNKNPADDLDFWIDYTAFLADHALDTIESWQFQLSGGDGALVVASPEPGVQGGAGYAFLVGGTPGLTYTVAYALQTTGGLYRTDFVTLTINQVGTTVTVAGAPQSGGIGGLITAAAVDSNGNLLLTLTSGQVLNAGDVVGPPGSPGLSGAAGGTPTIAMADATLPSLTIPAYAFNALLGPLLPYGVVENANAAWGNTIGMYASDDRAIAAVAGRVKGDGSYTVNPTAIAQAALNCTALTGYGITMGRDKLRCTAPIIYPSNPLFKPFLHGEGGGFVRAFDSTQGLLYDTTNYSGGLIQNLLADESNIPIGPTMRGINLETAADCWTNYLTGRLTTDLRDRWTVNMGDGEGMADAIELRLNPAKLPQAGDTSISVLDNPGPIANGAALMSARLICWGSRITAAPVADAFGGYTLLLAPWTAFGATAAVIDTVPPLWTSSATKTSPIGNAIFVDAKADSYPDEFFIGAPLDFPGTNVLAGSIVRAIYPNLAVAQRLPGATYARGAQIGVYVTIDDLTTGRIFTMTASAAGTAATTGPGPWSRTQPTTDGTCQWTYAGVAGFVVQLQPPSGQANAITAVIPPGTPLMAPPRVILRTGICTSNTDNQPGPWHPRKWQGEHMDLLAHSIHLQDCESLNESGSNAFIAQGHGIRTSRLRISATDGINNRIGGQGNAGGFLLQGGDAVHDDPIWSTGADCCPVGPKRGLQNGVLGPLSAWGIHIVINNPEFTCYLARGLAVFQLPDGTQTPGTGPFVTVNAPIYVEMNGGRTVAMPYAGALNNIQQNSGRKTTVIVTGHELDLRYNWRLGSWAVESEASLTSTFIMRKCRIRGSRGPALQINGNHDLVELDGLHVEACRETQNPNTANVQIFGAATVHLGGHNKFAGAPGGAKALQIGANPGMDSLGQALGNTVTDLSVESLTAYATDDGGIAIDIQHTTGATLSSGRIRVRQASPQGTQSGVLGVRVNLANSDQITIDHLASYVDGPSLTLLGSGGKVTTGFDMPADVTPLPPASLSALIGAAGGGANSLELIGGGSLSLVS